MKKSGLIPAFAAAVIAAGNFLPLVPLNTYAGQQLGQTDFEEGIGLPWHICETEPADMDFEIDDGVYKITINNPGGYSNGGEDRWDCQFRHRGLKIISGHKYKVSYEITSSESGGYYTKIGNLDGDVEVWHNMSTGDSDFWNTWDLIYIGAGETKKVDVTFTANQSLDVAEWAFHLGGDGQYTPEGCFPAGTVITFDNMSLIDLSGDENDYVPPEQWQRADILTNQVGYFTGRTKKATMLCDDEKSIDFNIKDSSGKIVYSGKSENFGHDWDSGDDVHIIDFSDFNDTGTFYIEAENGSESREFSVGNSSVYSGLLYDSLNYFYQNRSGIDIESKYITSGDKKALARKAGHPSDIAEITQEWGYNTGYGSIDVTGGWYDAGDHGKYVVNGGISLWLMQNQYETALKYGFEDVYADGTMSIPENSNGYPDLLDEARWEMEWMLTMIVNDGYYDNMVYHKVHDYKWTALGVAPADDDMPRIVKPPTTAATLNLAACAAQSARLWRGIDDDFADECLDAAERCYAAALEFPDMYAPLDESIGGGAYGDTDSADEFYWAAMELFITTGDKSYYKDAADYEGFLDVPVSLSGGESVDTVGSFDWGNTAALGTLSAAINPDGFSKKEVSAITDEIQSAANYYIDAENNQGYGLPYGQSTISYDDSDTGYLWGSNSFVADNSIIMAYAYLLTENTDYLDGVVSGIDYLLGRNPMDYSYVTGYGTHTVEYPHHRYWANQIYSDYPKAPCGVLAGGPNSGMQDPWVRGSGWKKGEIAPQKCYLDHIEAWSVNECTINWNAPLAWITAFAAEENGGIETGQTGETAGVSNDGGNGESNNSNGAKGDKKEEAAKPAEKAVQQEVQNDDSKPDSSKKNDSSLRNSAGSNESVGGISANVGIIGIITSALVVLVIAVLMFIYKMAQLKYGSDNNNGNKDENK